MGFLTNARHNLGFHTGDWEFDAQGSCEQTRRCDGCKDVSTRVRHSLSAWTYRMPRDANACTKDRTCVRCALTEAEQEHSFKWYYYNEVQQGPGLLTAFVAAHQRLTSPCKQFIACEHCGESGKADRVQHVWSDLERQSDSNYYRECARCGDVEKTRMPFG